MFTLWLNQSMYEFLREAFTGKRLAWPDSEDASTFLEFTGRHGIGPLLHSCLSASGSLAQWPAEIRESLELERRRQVAMDLRFEHELPKVLQGLAEAGVQP